jgi:hypothetical protein
MACGLGYHFRILQTNLKMRKRNFEGKSRTYGYDEMQRWQKPRRKSGVDSKVDSDTQEPANVLRRWSVQQFRASDCYHGRSEHAGTVVAGLAMASEPSVGR